MQQLNVILLMQTATIYNRCGYWWHIANIQA